MKKTIITLLALGSVAMAATTTEEFSFGNASTVQLANQYDMGQSWTLSFDFTISPATQGKRLNILSTDPAMGRGVNVIAYSDPKLPALFAPNVEKLYNVTSWEKGGDITCTMLYNSDKDTLAIKFVTDSEIRNFTANGVDYSSKVLTMFTTDLTGAGAGWGISGGTFTGEAIAPNPNAPAAPVVPEPTTATLSLLALAGLAARRRRK